MNIVVTLAPKNLPFSGGIGRGGCCLLRATTSTVCVRPLAISTTASVMRTRTTGMNNDKHSHLFENQILNQISSYKRWSVSSSTTGQTAQELIEPLVKNANEKVVVFMKGTPDAPRCGFSNAVVQIMRMHGVVYKSYDVLEDDKIRNGVKEYTNWPTIPQVFFEGEFIGGCDILLQMHKSGELLDELKKVGIKSELSDAAGKDDHK